MGSITAGVFSALLLTSTLALPSRRSREDATAVSNNFVGEGTNDLATAILQGYVDTDKNLAFSPLGYSALLAILAEGAQGDTRAQLVNALHLPEDVTVTRNAYKAVLQQLTERNSNTKPEFRNWFYIYKNFSVEPEYRKILQENYLTEVKDVDRIEGDCEKIPDSAQHDEKAPSDEQHSIKPDTSDSIAEAEKPNLDETKVEESISSEKAQELVAPANVEIAMLPEKMEDVALDEIKDSKTPEKLEDSLEHEKLEDPLPEKTEGSIPETNDFIPEKDSLPEKSEVSIIPEKMKDSIESEPILETIVNDKKEGSEKENDPVIPENLEESTSSDGEIAADKVPENIINEKLPEKSEAPADSADSPAEEIMQVSGDEASKTSNEDGPLRIVFPIPFPEKLKLRKINDEREASPSGEVMTMQEEMLGNKEEITNDDKKEENKEVMKDDKEDKEEIKDEKIEPMKDDKTETIKDEQATENNEDKQEEIQDKDNREIIYENKKETIKSESTDKKEAIKDESNDKMETTKDKMETEKEEVMKDENMESAKEDKKEVIVEEMMDDNKKKEEIEKNEEIIAGAQMEDDMKVDPMKEKGLISQAIKEIKEASSRQARHIDIARFIHGSVEPQDITSSLSGNNIVIKSTQSKRLSQILVFNGLYFKGIWETPFEKQREDSFYKSDSEKSTVTMMNVQGNFRVGNVPDLDSVAIEIPYKGGRYSLLVLMPNSRTGLRQLIADLTGYSLRKVQKHLEQQEVELCLPSFEVQTTTKPIQALNKFGVSDVFSQEQADLSGISKDSGLFVEELVQLVTVRVDNASGAYNQVTASNPSTRSGLSKFVADHPFLYFVRDTVDNLIVVAGKVVDPSVLPENP